MDSGKNEIITVQTAVHAPIEEVWKLWTSPEHIAQWNNASEDWHTPWAKNDLRAGGKFVYRMEAKDGTVGFDFNGIYTTVEPHRLIEYAIEDGRRVRIEFENVAGEIQIIEAFEAENENPVELQRNGWQAILNNFKRYVETMAGN